MNKNGEDNTTENFGKWQNGTKRQQDIHIEHKSIMNDDDETNMEQASKNGDEHHRESQ